MGRLALRCNNLAQAANMPAYHSNLTSSERALCLENWQSGVTPWVIATSGLGTGIDIPSIVHVVHFHPPYGLVDFMQQTGRAGRGEGDMANSVIITHRPQSELHSHHNDITHANHSAMNDYILTDFHNRILELCSAQMEKDEATRSPVRSSTERQLPFSKDLISY